MMQIYTLTLNPILDRTLTVKDFVFNEMVRATSSRLDPSGKGYNVARGLKALGIESCALGLLGGGTGRLVEQMLRDEGLTLDPLWINGETRTATMIFCGDQYIKVNEVGPQVSAGELAELMGKIKQYLAPDQLWVLSGSIPPGVPVDIYAQLTQLLQKGGAQVLLDASGESLRQGIQARPHIAKPNMLEAGEYLGRLVESEADAQEAVDALLQAGVSMVALSMGADGLLLATQQEQHRIYPPVVQALNPIGAGDGLVAGMVYALAKGMGLVEVARWGVAAGTAAAMQAGTTYGRLYQVRELVSEV